MGLKNKLFHIDCAEANNCCDKAQYNNASLTEKLKLLFHLAMCKACRKYTNRNQKLTKLVDRSNLQSCSQTQKKQWKETIEKEYVKNNT